MKSVAKYIAIGFVVLALVAVSLFYLSRSRDFQVFGEIVHRVETNDKVIALTFDDGPVPGATEKIISILAQEQIPATFFLTGREMERYPDGAKKLIAAGHQIGNHSYSHPRMVFMSYQTVANEVAKTNELIRNLGYKNEIVFRPPYGKKLLMLPLYLQRNNITTVIWDIEPETFSEVSASSEKITEHVVAEAKPGSIILLHVMYPSRQTSMDAVPSIIRELKAQGYRFVTVNDLLTLTSRK